MITVYNTSASGQPDAIITDEFGRWFALRPGDKVEFPSLTVYVGTTPVTSGTAYISTDATGTILTTDATQWTFAAGMQVGLMFAGAMLVFWIIQLLKKPVRES